jgi:cysteine-rich repeat protein
MVEVCGDGMNLGRVGCDDGNTVSGDGCSSTCSVEAGYTCLSSGPKQRDFCYDSVAPRASVESVSKANIITISFSEVVVCSANSK